MSVINRIVIKISTHLLTVLIICVIVRLEQRAMHNSVPASEKNWDKRKGNGR